MSKLPTVRPSQQAVAAMSHSKALSRLTLGDRRRDMFRWALRRWLEKFEQDWNYDASYMGDMIDASPRAAWLFSRVTALGQFRRDLPIEAWCAAGITAVRHGLRPMHATRRHDGGVRRCQSSGSTRRAR